MKVVVLGGYGHYGRYIAQLAAGAPQREIGDQRPGLPGQRGPGRYSTARNLETAEQRDAQSGRSPSPMSPGASHACRIIAKKAQR